MGITALFKFLSAREILNTSKFHKSNQAYPILLTLPYLTNRRVPSQTLLGHSDRVLNTRDLAHNFLIVFNTMLETIKIYV